MTILVANTNKINVAMFLCSLCFRNGTRVRPTPKVHTYAMLLSHITANYELQAYSILRLHNIHIQINQNSISILKLKCLNGQTDMTSLKCVLTHIWPYFFYHLSNYQLLTVATAPERHKLCFLQLSPILSTLLNTFAKRTPMISSPLCFINCS